MKNFIFLLFSVLLLLTSCQKKQTVYCCDGPPYEAHFQNSKFKKGEVTQWYNNPFADTVKKDTITVWSTKGNLLFKLKFILDKPASAGLGYDPTKYETVFYQNTTPGKVLIYQLDSAATNTLHLESREQWLLAQFKFTFKLKTLTGNITFDTTRVYFPTGGAMVNLRK